MSNSCLMANVTEGVRHHGVVFRLFWFLLVSNLNIEHMQAEEQHVYYTPCVYLYMCTIHVCVIRRAGIIQTITRNFRKNANIWGRI